MHRQGIVTIFLCVSVDYLEYIICISPSIHVSEPIPFPRLKKVLQLVIFWWVSVSFDLPWHMIPFILKGSHLSKFWNLSRCFIPNIVYFTLIWIRCGSCTKSSKINMQSIPLQSAVCETTCLLCLICLHNPACLICLRSIQVTHEWCISSILYRKIRTGGVPELIIGIGEKV